MKVDYEALTQYTEQAPLWGANQVPMLKMLDVFHARQHNDPNPQIWMSTINGFYYTECGVKVDMLIALRHSGGLRN